MQAGSECRVPNRISLQVVADTSSHVDLFLGAYEAVDVSARFSEQRAKEVRSKKARRSGEQNGSECRCRLSSMLRSDIIGQYAIGRHLVQVRRKVIDSRRAGLRVASGVHESFQGVDIGMIEKQRFGHVTTQLACDRRCQLDGPKGIEAVAHQRYGTIDFAGGKAQTI